MPAMTDPFLMPPGERAAYANGRESVERELHRMTEALTDIRELVDGYEDIDHNGNPNLAMRVMTVVEIVLSRK
jgi:hypothetical protein